MKKNNLLFILFWIALLWILSFIILNKWLVNKQDINDDANKHKFIKWKSIDKIAENNSGINYIYDLPKKEIEQEKKLPKENVPAYKILITDDDKTVKEKQRKFMEKMRQDWFNNELDKYLQAICWWKSNIDDISCNWSYSFFVPRLHYFLQKIDKKYGYKNAIDFMVSWVIRNCPNVKWEDMELLLRWLKEWDITCSKEVTNIFNDRYKKLEDLFKNYQLSEQTLAKPFEFYYGISNDLTDVKQRKLQVLILENINKQVTQKYNWKEKFKKNVLSYLWYETLEDLKEWILKDYRNLFNNYHLQDCKLKLEWYSNYFIWIPIEHEAVSCIEKKLLDKWYERDYNKLMEELSAYTYFTKVFLWEKAQAKAIFGPEWVWITNILDINAVINEKKK